MVSQRIKYAMAHLSRKQHTRLLARPNWRRLRRTDANIVADPNTIPRAALRSKASKRIKIMARPKYVTKKYDSLRDYPTPYQRVHPKTLAAKSTRRILDLAVPKKRWVRTWNLNGVTENLPDNVFEQQTIEYRKPPPREHDWERHREIIAKLAMPKVFRRPKTFIVRKKWRPVDMSWIENLAQPVSRDIPMDRDAFSVAPGALTYKITSRMMQLVYPKDEPEIIPPRIPGTVSRAALKAIASPRTVDLARPVVRPAGMETDLREDAFTVSPAALKARCSRRLKKLARPKNYKPKKY